MNIINRLIHTKAYLPTWLHHLIRYRYLFFLIAALGLWLDAQVYNGKSLVGIYSITALYLGLVYSSTFLGVFYTLTLTFFRFYLSPDGLNTGYEVFVFQWMSYFAVWFAVSLLVKNYSKQLENKEQIEHMAYHDALTGLPNRNNISRYLEKEIGVDGKKFALMFIDLDRFKYVNDTMGHDVGDEMLIEVAQRLLTSVRDQDMVARQGGDEFIILLEFKNEDEVSELAQRIIEEFSIPFNLNNESIYSSVSIGISTYPEDGTNTKELQKYADKAMYLAKERGRNTFEFYQSEPEDIMLRKVRLETGLRRAIENKEFTLFYQPQIELESGFLIGMEALIRWRNDESGFISPAEFIPLAEETGLITRIGKWVLEDACQQISHWHKAGLKPIPVSVNVSVKQFKDRNFIQIVKNALNDAELEPHYLHLEITESIMQNFDESDRILKELKNLGIKLSIDDFGTGYSSLNVLKHLQIDYIKIDQSFIKDTAVNAGSASIVKTIIDMGHNLGFQLVAEGIEEEQHLEFLKDHKCELGQGYYFSKPLPAKEMEQFILESK